MGIYVFVGSGEGVPGLPHEISPSQTKSWAEDYSKQLLAFKSQGLKDEEIERRLASHPHIQLTAALKIGNYQEQSGAKGTSEAPQPSGADKKR